MSKTLKSFCKDHVWLKLSGKKYNILRTDVGNFPRFAQRTQIVKIKVKDEEIGSQYSRTDE